MPHTVRKAGSKWAIVDKRTGKRKGSRIQRRRRRPRPGFATKGRPMPECRFGPGGGTCLLLRPLGRAHAKAMEGVR
jgi:hypothetical protein